MAGRQALIAAAIGVLAGLGPSAPAADAPQIRSFAGAEAVPSVRWVLPVGTVDSEEDEVDGISVDPEGNTIISGVFRNAITWGEERRQQSAGAGDIFIASLSPTGSVRWVQRVGAGGDDNSYDLTTDGAGNIYISGWFSETVRFGDVTLRSRGDTDMFVVKLAPDGSTRWARAFGGPMRDGGNEIAVLANGEVAVAALTAGDFTIDGKTYAHGGGQRDSLLLRLAPDGALRWVAQFNGPGNERLRAVAMNPAGEVFLGFQFRGVMRFGALSFTSKGDWDGALLKLDAAGKLLWGRQVGGAGTDNVRGVGAGPDGSVYAAGVLTGAAAVIDRSVPARGRSGNDYVARVSPSGSVEWLVTIDGDGRGVGTELQADARGVIVSGILRGRASVRRDGETLLTLGPPAGRATSLLTALTADGRLRFVFTPHPGGGGAGALGDVLSVSRDGRFLAQSLLFRGRLRVAEQEVRTPSRMDSVVVFLTLNGA